jgi:hypothetical protein
MKKLFIIKREGNTEETICSLTGKDNRENRQQAAALIEGLILDHPNAEFYTSKRPSNWWKN